MMKTRKAHLWIGLICSIFIFIESATGLLMNEPWLIGQSQTESKSNFQPGQFNQGGTAPSSDQSTTNQGQQNGLRMQANGQSDTNGQTQNGTPAQGQAGNNSNGQFQGPGGNGVPNGEGTSSGSFMSVIKGLHQGRIGTTSIKWLIDLVAVVMMFLTGTGIYLSIKVLGANKKRKKISTEKIA